ncbi:MAG TPA: crossover junction endodeoxyribonuclease RuvC [Anaerolineae bacterium]|nr:crossover junction endodeoxyribonuclease RuvC [Anaerolineae bacterium]HIQ05133.1 crossover junction endodeoxyribonuclease RuvC [Anaerolineae bacterium]
MLVLGVDPGTAITGYGLVRENTAGDVHLVTYGVIRTAAVEPLPQRLQMIYQELQALLRRYHPDVAAVEELFFNRNARTALAVGQARGVVLLALVNAGLPIHEYTPLQVKQALVGYGRATKAQVQEMTRLVLSLDQTPRPDDAADAVAVAVCHIHSARLTALLSTTG